MVKELVQEVIDWAEGKGIYAKLSADSQRVFALGEITNEFHDAIAKKKSLEEIKTELGDAAVFYINYIVLEKNLRANYIGETCQEALGVSLNYVDAPYLKIILDGLSWSANGLYIRHFFVMLHRLAHSIDSTLEECLRLAHQKNLGRSHEMRDGKLVKKEDL